MAYPPELRGEIESSIFRTKRPGLHVKKETVVEHFKKPIKNVGRGRFLTKIKDDHYKETW